MGTEPLDAAKPPLLDLLGVDLTMGAMLMRTAPEEERRNYMMAFMETLKEKYRDDEAAIVYLAEHTQPALREALGLPSEEQRLPITELLGLPQPVVENASTQEDVTDETNDQGN